MALTMVPMALAVEDGDLANGSLQTVACTKTEDCAAAIHDPGCPKATSAGTEKGPLPCTKTEGCTLADGYEGECKVPSSTPVCAHLEGCTEDVHAEGCPLYTAPDGGGTTSPTAAGLLQVRINALPDVTALEAVGEEKQELVYQEARAIEDAIAALSEDQRTGLVTTKLEAVVTWFAAKIALRNTGRTCTEPCTPLTNATTTCPVCNVSGHWGNGVYVYDTGVTMTEKQYVDATGKNETFTVANYHYLTSCQGLKDTVYVNSTGYTVYTTTASSADAVIGTGDGTMDHPYQNLQTALYNVKPGGTIIILGNQVESVAPAKHPYPYDIRDDVLELDRPVTIKAATPGVVYEGKVQFQNFPGAVDGSWTGTKNAGGGWDTFCTNNTISGTVAFDGINFTNAGSDIISNYNIGTDLENCELVLTNCLFSNMQSGSAIRISRNIKNVSIQHTDFTVTRTLGEGYQKAYLVWTDSTQALTISDCTFNGNGIYRAAVHVGNGHLSGTTASIAGNTFTGFERCIQLALVNSKTNTTIITGNTFENIQLSTTQDNTTNAYEYGAIFIHESHQKNGSSDSSITLTGNRLTGTSNRWFYTESTFPIEYFNITMDGQKLGNMDFHKHLAQGAVTYYPKFPVLAPVTNGSGCGGYILKAVGEAFSGASDGDTLTLLRDVTLSGRDTPESATAAVTVDKNLNLVLPPEITLEAPGSSNSVTVNADNVLTLPGWYEAGATGNDGESGGAIVIGDAASLAVNGTLYNGGNIVLNGADAANLSGKITLRPGGEVYSKLDRDNQILNWIKYTDRLYSTSGVTGGYNPKYVYYGPSITPVDVTVYMGGESYAGVVDNNGIISANSSGLPTPGFRITLPDTMSGADITTLTFVGNGGRAWKAVSYDGVSTTIFKLVPTGTNTDPVRVQFKVGNQFVVSDKFDVGHYVNQTLAMSIYPGDPGDPVTSVSVTYNGHTYDVDFSGAATLTVRGTTSQVQTPAVTTPESLVTKADQPAVTAPSGTQYKINGKDVYANADGVSLLFDEIIETGTGSTERTRALTARADQYLGPAGGFIARNYEFKYLDLVDESNGNVWVAAVDAQGRGQNVTVYWPLPEGTSRYTGLTLLHFEGLHREASNGTISPSDIAACQVSNVAITDVTDTHVVFNIGSGGFSPFVLVWESSSWQPPITPPVTPPVTPEEPDEPDQGPDGLNTRDHYAYIVGYPDGTVRPEGSITRAEVATIFFRLLTDEARSANWSQVSGYTDVTAASWYNNAISTLSRMGILEGYDDDTFRPNGTITRAEFVTIATRFFRYSAKYTGGFSDVPSGAWYADYIQAGVDLGLIGGYPDGTFVPDGAITRAEACTIVNRTLGRAPDKDHLLPESEMLLWPDNLPGDWYYAQLQEATNSHDYTWLGSIEQWTEKLPERDWEALEN